MPARPILSSVPGAGITVDGIVDVLGGKSIVQKRIASGNVLKGQIVEVAAAGKVKAATQNCAVDAFAGVAVSSAADGEYVSVLRHGVARVAVEGEVVVGDSIASFGDGYVCKVGDNGKDETTATTVVIAEVSDAGAGYADVEIALLGKAI